MTPDQFARELRGIARTVDVYRFRDAEDLQVFLTGLRQDLLTRANRVERDAAEAGCKQRAAEHETMAPGKRVVDGRVISVDFRRRPRG
jgi:hypothetical protein